MKPLTTPVSYRQDINGLRAWAVLAVLLFHFKLPGCGAGFIGVDVFFVISGFLMTAIIAKGLESNNFSIWKFYLARARRILPALMALLTALLILGWFWLPTADYQVLGAQSTYSLSFLSNMFFGFEGNYFSGPYDKWLLHTWSLGVEFQFYLLFPIFLLAVWFIKPAVKTIVWAVSLLFIVSLGINIAVSMWKPTIAFYILPTRGWELATGGLVFLLGRKASSLERFAKPMFWLGVILLVVSGLLLNSKFIWPSGWALLPVIAAALVLLGQQSDSKLLNNPIAQWLGDRSYSLYLWHWPLVVAIHFIGLNNEWPWVAGAFAMSLVLGHLSYHLVEMPTQSYLSKRKPSWQAITIGVSFIILLAMVLVVKNVTFTNRINPIIDKIAKETTNYSSLREACQPNINGLNSPGCIFGAGTDFSAFLIGDSLSDMVTTSVGAAAEKHGQSIKFYGRMGCPTIKGVEIALSSRIACSNFNNWLFDFLEKDDSGKPVIIVNTVWHSAGKPPKVSIKSDIAQDKGFDEFFIENMVSSICEIAAKRDVYLVRPVPHAGVHVPKKLSRDLLFGRISLDNIKDISTEKKNYMEVSSLIWDAQDRAEKQCGAKILNPLPYLCDEEHCYGSRDGRPLYYDAIHLSEYGNKFLVPMFEEVFITRESEN